MTLGLLLFICDRKMKGFSTDGHPHSYTASQTFLQDLYESSGWSAEHHITGSVQVR